MLLLFTKAQPNAKNMERRKGIVTFFFQILKEFAGFFHILCYQNGTSFGFANRDAQSVVDGFTLAEVDGGRRGTVLRCSQPCMLFDYLLPCGGIQRICTATMLEASSLRKKTLWLTFSISGGKFNFIINVIEPHTSLTSIS